MKKIAMICLASLLAFGSVACSGGGGGNKKIDATKTQLNVTTFEGGYGTAWLEAVKARFEAEYAETEFEPGKKGVQVWIKEDRNLTHELLVQNLEGSEQEVFFTEAVNYGDLQSRGLLYDISSAVTENIAGEEASIEDKMRDAHKDYFKASDGKYYGIPFYEANYGIIYDVDLFEKELLYFAAEGKGDKDGFVKTEKTARSNGPDGKSGTYDDGLPATYDDFFKLCNKMVSQGITPITWNGKNPQYVNALVEALQADYEGQESMFVNYSNSGTVELVESINDDGTLNLYEEEITAENGYLTWTRQAGKYYGLKFVERLTANESYYVKKDVVSPSYEHLDAQNAFVTGKFIDSNPTYGMLIDGSWWHNESSNTFKAAAKKFGEQKAGAMARRFSFMPLPKATAEKVGETYNIVEVNRSICFVNGNLEAKKEKVVTEFVQFCHSNASLAEFTSLTYTCKPYAYTMTEAELNKIPYWGRELYRMHNEANFMTTYSSAPLYQLNENAYTEHWESKMFQTNVNGTTLGIVTEAMILNKVSAKDYFNGLADYLTPTRWEKEFMFTEN